MNLNVKKKQYDGRPCLTPSFPLTVLEKGFFCPLERYWFMNFCLAEHDTANGIRDPQEGWRRPIQAG
jgi:hypothetical protein